MTSAQAVLRSLRLTFTHNWNELEAMVTAGTLPAALADCLKSLISAEQHDAIGPDATPHLVQLANEHLSHGITLTDAEGRDRLYDVMVFVPDEGRMNLRSFFRLVPRYSGGQLKYPWQTPRTIRLTYRTSDYHACLDNNPAIWGRGTTPAGAIGDLIQTHREFFDVEIREHKLPGQGEFPL